jgi:hypothetical protein
MGRLRPSGQHGLAGPSRRGMHDAPSKRSPCLVRGWRHDHYRRGGAGPAVGGSRVHGKVTGQGGERRGSPRQWLDVGVAEGGQHCGILRWRRRWGARPLGWWPPRDLAATQGRRHHDGGGQSRVVDGDLVVIVDGGTGWGNPSQRQWSWRGQVGVPRLWVAQRRKGKEMPHHGW